MFLYCRSCEHHNCTACSGSAFETLKLFWGIWVSLFIYKRDHVLILGEHGLSLTVFHVARVILGHHNLSGMR